jgi:hypothetical protein
MNSRALSEWSSYSWSPPWPRPFFPDCAQFGRVASSRKSLGGSKLLPLRMMYATFIGDLQCCRHFLEPFLRSVPRHNPLSDLYGQFLWPHGLVFALICTVNCGTLYRPVCSFPNPVQSIDFTTGELQSCCRNGMHLSSISSLIAKGLNTYVNEVFLFFINL